MKLLLIIAYTFFLSIVAHSQIDLWGMTMYGGSTASGNIYKIDTAGNQTIIYEFSKIEGGSPGYSYLTEVNGRFYGMTSSGGINGVGVLFEYNPLTNTYTKKIDFGGINGISPFGGLVLASDGMLYGMTYNGGINSLGVLFQYDPVSNIYTKKIDFDGAVNGSYPYGSLIAVADGKLYGMTSAGGLNSSGVLFQYDPLTNSYLKKIDFDGTNKGKSPRGSLTEASNGMLYGLTYQGGVNNLGVLFQYDPTLNIFTKRIDFDGVGNGSNPHSSKLIQAADGKLYGVTHHGGANLQGVLFQYDFASNVYTKKVDFDGTVKGSNPQGSLVEASDGNLYGLTRNGGSNNLGALFQYSPTNSTFNKKIDFNGVLNGNNPSGSLLMASNGSIYGLTDAGGINSSGVLFSYDFVSNNFIKQIDLEFAINGSSPTGPLTNAFNGKLYGVTSSGGINGSGVLFQYDLLTNSFTKNIDFNSSVNGGSPIGGLVLASDGKLYGTTTNGGIYNSGVLFQFDPINHILVKKFDFNGTSDGYNPYGTMIQGIDGKLYGMTYLGGLNNVGVIFQYDISSNIFTKKIDFLGGTSIAYPQGSLIQLSNGIMYGSSMSGGVNGKGAFFQYDPVANLCVKRIDFAGSTNGSNPRSSIILASNGKFFGTTPQGGINNNGTIYDYDPLTNLLTKKIDFVNDSYPYGALFEASDGKLYGAFDFGTAGCGGVYQYDIATNLYKKKMNFNISNGCAPYLSSLIEVPSILTSLVQNTNLNNVIVYPNPNNGIFTIKLNSKAQIKIANVLGEFVFSQSFDHGKQSINLYDQSNGIYFVIVQFENGSTVTEKAIIKR